MGTNVGTDPRLLKRSGIPNAGTNADDRIEDDQDRGEDEEYKEDRVEDIHIVVLGLGVWFGFLDVVENLEPDTVQFGPGCEEDEG